MPFCLDAFLNGLKKEKEENAANVLRCHVSEEKILQLALLGATDFARSFASRPVGEYFVTGTDMEAAVVYPGDGDLEEDMEAAVFNPGAGVLEDDMKAEVVNPGDGDHVVDM